MHIETAANPADGGVATPDAPAQESTAPQVEATTPAEGVADDLDALTKEALGETDASPEFLEVEIDGRKYKIAAGDDQPLDPDLKFGALREADYRKKTMSLAEERRAFQEERQAAQARANLEGEALVRAHDLRAIDAKVSQLSQLSVSELRRAGYSEADIQQVASDLSKLVEQRDNLARQVQQDVHAMNEADAQAVKDGFAKAVSSAALLDKALTPERCEYLVGMAKQLGFDEQDVTSITDPTAFKVLHYADIGMKFSERQRAAAQMKAAGAGKPSTNVGGTNSPSNDPESMSAGEYMDWVRKRDAAT